MTKGDLVEQIAKRAGLSRVAAQLVVNTLFGSLVEALDAGEKNELRGFGSFRSKVRRARTARNPKTGERVDVACKRVPTFRAGKELKYAVNGGRKTQQ